MLQNEWLRDWKAVSNHYIHTETNSHPITSLIMNIVILELWLQSKLTRPPFSWVLNENVLGTMEERGKESYSISGSYLLTWRVQLQKYKIIDHQIILSMSVKLS